MNDLLVGHSRAGAACRPHRLDHLVPVGGIADRDGLRDRIRAHWLGVVEILIERAHDRRAARGLCRVDARQIAIDQADLAQLA